MSPFWTKVTKAVICRISNAAKALKTGSFVLEEYWNLVLSRVGWSGLLQTEGREEHRRTSAQGA